MKFIAQTIGKYFELDLDVLKEHIENAYNLKILHPLENPLKGDVNINFAFESSLGKKIIRLYGAFSEYTEKELQIMQYLVNNGFLTATPLVNYQGELISMFGDYQYSIFDFLEGGKPLYTSRMFYRIGEAVGQLQKLLKSSTIAIRRENHTLQIYKRKDELINFIQRNIDLVKDLLTKEEFATIYPQLEMFQKVILPEGNLHLVHGDLYNPNIIDTGEKAAIIDFEYIAQGPSTIDKIQYLAWDGICNTRTANTPGVYKKDPYILRDQMRAYIEGYRKVNPGIQFGSQQDFDVMILLNVGDTVFNLEKSIKNKKNLFQDYMNNYNNAKILKGNEKEVKKLLGFYS